MASPWQEHWSSFNLGAVRRISYQAEVPGDLNGDCAVNIGDLLTLLSEWGPCPGPCPPSCVSDVTGDCSVDISDLLVMLANWG